MSAARPERKEVRRHWDRGQAGVGQQWCGRQQGGGERYFFPAHPALIPLGSVEQVRLCVGVCQAGAEAVGTGNFFFRDLWIQNRVLFFMDLWI